MGRRLDLRNWSVADGSLTGIEVDADRCASVPAIQMKALLIGFMVRNRRRALSQIRT
jgi:hypothetical protein